MINFITYFSYYAQCFVFWLIVTCGFLFLVVCLMMAGSAALSAILQHGKGWGIFCEYVWHRDEFKAWLRNVRGRNG